MSTKIACGVCLAPYNRTRLPLLLNCHHTFCCECLSYIVKEDDSITCPMCRQVTRVGHGLGSNFALLDLLSNESGDEKGSDLRELRDTVSQKVRRSQQQQQQQGMQSNRSWQLGTLWRSIGQSIGQIGQQEIIQGMEFLSRVGPTVMEMYRQQKLLNQEYAERQRDIASIHRDSSAFLLDGRSHTGSNAS